MFSNAAMQAMSAAYGLLGGNFVSPRIGGYGLLGQQPAGSQGYGQTGNLMAQYLQNLYMRRYNPPALAQYPGMVGLQLGPGGMAYQAPHIRNVPLPTNQNRGAWGMGGSQDNSAAINNWLQQQYAYAMSGGGGG